MKTRSGRYEAIAWFPIRVVVILIVTLLLWPVLLFEWYQNLVGIEKKKKMGQFPANIGNEVGICAVFMIWVYAGIIGYFVYKYYA